MNTQEERLLSSQEVGRILNCSKRSVYRYSCSSKIPAPVRLSGSTKWKMSDVMLFLECNCDMAKYKARKEAEQC